jgi:hypothetical protein
MAGYIQFCPVRCLDCSLSLEGCNANLQPSTEYIGHALLGLQFAGTCMRIQP